MRALPRLIIALLLALSLAVSATAFAEPAQKPMSFVKDGYKTVINVLDKDVQARDQALRGLLTASIDYPDLARRSLGDHWAKLTAEQQKLYTETFTELIERTYVKNLSRKKPNTDYTLEWDRARKKGDKHIASVFVIYEDTETQIDFVLIPKGDQWSIFDMSYDGASVEKTYVKNHGKILDEEGFDALISKMRERIAKL